MIVDLIGVVLAGGDSRRMGRPKALLALDGRPFVELILARMREAGVDSILVVVGRHRDAILEGADLSGAGVVANPDPDRGQFSSLRTVVETLAARQQAPAALVALVDHPAVQTRTYRALIDAWRSGDRSGVFLTRHRGKRGHPLLFGPAELGRALELPPTAQMRELVKRPEHRIVDVDVDDPAVNRDVDTQDEYERLVRSARRDAQPDASPQPRHDQGGLPT